MPCAAAMGPPAQPLWDPVQLGQWRHAAAVMLGNGGPAGAHGGVVAGAGSMLRAGMRARRTRGARGCSAAAVSHCARFHCSFVPCVVRLLFTRFLYLFSLFFFIFISFFTIFFPSFFPSSLSSACVAAGRWIAPSHAGDCGGGTARGGPGTQCHGGRAPRLVRHQEGRRLQGKEINK